MTYTNTTNSPILSSKEAQQLLSKSKISLITYSSISELYKDEILSGLNFYDLKKLDSDSCIKSILRDIKLENILENKKDVDFILLDLNQISVSIYGLNRIEIIKRILQNFISIDSKYKMIITGISHRSYSREDDKYQYSTPGGNLLIYKADLVLGIAEGNIIKVLKSRY